MNWNHLEKPDPLAQMQAGRAHRTAENWPTPPDVQPPATVAVAGHCEVCGCPMTIQEHYYTRSWLCVDHACERDEREARNAR